MLIVIAPSDKEWVGFKVEDLETGESVLSAVWTIPVGLTNVSTHLSLNEAVILLSGFTLGTRYRLYCKLVTTKGGRTINRYMDILATNMTGSELV